MTRILVQRGSASSSSSSNQARSTVPSSSSSSAPPVQEEPVGLDDNTVKTESLSESEEIVNQIGIEEVSDKDKTGNEDVLDSEVTVEALRGLSIGEPSVGSSQIVSGSSYPPPPPVPPPKPVITNLSSRRTVSCGSNALGIGSSRRAVAWPVVSTKTSSASRPSSPKSEGYNSADEQNPCYGPSYDDAEKEHRFEHDIRRAKGFDVKRMLEDGNCLFRAVADQVYGDTEAYDLVRQMCIDYMERERDHFSQFITEGFTAYCKRKRRDKVYGNNAEIQALSEMYNRPIHIYSYSTEPINIFHGSYNTDTPPIRLSYHHGNHYNALVDPRRLAIGAGLGFSNLQGANIDKDRVKAAIKAQQDQQIDNALIAEGRFYSDIELTEREIEHMVMEASRSEYLADDKFKQTLGFRESSTSSAEPSSSGATTTGSSRSDSKEENVKASGLSSSVQTVLSMGFSYLQVIEAYSIFGDDVDSIVCYLLETCSGKSAPGSFGRINSRKGKATE
ncbi:hypothetical protein GIB67_012737 [Kingdonia uniflora]|uniref:ubiquitinyl hydrolase 1 n=1 Tax=Kingdonia uniflora TaxID=39325 RepID=A0A7J7NFR3_9MAGN|nr:hypothetical protein GIB67_012737 [Kingdonia uniflora]